MKFVVRNVSNGCRRGHVTDLPRFPDVTMETPACMLYTRTGSAPHLTGDLLTKLEGLPPMALMSANHFVIHKSALTAYGQGLAAFTNMTDRIIYTCANDPVKEVPAGYNDKNSIGLWAKGGKVKVDPVAYMSLQEVLKPDIFEVMADCDQDEDMSLKRLMKSSQRNLEWLDQCLMIKAKSEKLSQSLVLGVVTGGHVTDERCKMARELAVRPLDGYVIDGLHRGGDLKDFKMAAVRDVIKSALDELPVEKLRFIKGGFSPDQVMEAVRLGVDVMDSSYCYQVTERGSALTFDLNYIDYNNDKYLNTNNNGFEINLKGKTYFSDQSPLLEGCTCYTCRHHTRSYITHLLNTSELLANVLLMIHNFHHYFRFFKTIRQSLDDDKFQSLQNLITSQSPVNDV